MATDPIYRRRQLVSSAEIVFANLVPLFGVLFLGWELETILLLIWMEIFLLCALTVLYTVALGKPVPFRLPGEERTSERPTKPAAPEEVRFAKLMIEKGLLTEEQFRQTLKGGPSMMASLAECLVGYGICLLLSGACTLFVFGRPETPDEVYSAFLSALSSIADALSVGFWIAIVVMAWFNGRPFVRAFIQEKEDRNAESARKVDLASEPLAPQFEGLWSHTLANTFAIITATVLCIAMVEFGVALFVVAFVCVRIIWLLIVMGAKNLVSGVQRQALAEAGALEQEPQANLTDNYDN